jgi:hypothetical protein
MIKSYLFLFAFIFAFFTGCSNSSDSKTPNATSKTETRTSTESISFDYDGPACKTGKLHFTNSDAFCDALQGSDLSSKCSLAIRKSIFLKSCPSKTFNERAQQTETKIPVETPSASDTSETPQPVNIDDQEQSTNDKFTVGVNAILTLVRAKNYDSDICDQTVFSGSFTELYPKVPLSNVSIDITKNFMTDNYGQMQIKMFTSGLFIAYMDIAGQLEQLKKIKSYINLGTLQNIRLTESKKCAAKDPELILVDLVMAPGVSTQKLDLDARIEVIKADDQKNCVVVLNKTLRQLSQAKNPEADLEKAKFNYHIWDHSRQNESGELVSSRLSFSTDYDGYGSSETYLNIVLQTELTNSLIDQLSQHEKPVRMTGSQECKGKKFDDSIIVDEVLLK